MMSESNRTHEKTNKELTKKVGCIRWNELKGRYINELLVISERKTHDIIIKLSWVNIERSNWMKSKMILSIVLVVLVEVVKQLQDQMNES